MTLPYALLGPFAGVWVDRWDRRTVMVACDLARAPLAFALVWAPNLAVVLVLVTVSNVFSAFHLPAQQAAIRQTVPDDDLMAANALGQLASNGARLLGPALGGLAVAVASANFAFVLDGLTFLVSAMILSRLPALRDGDDDEAETAVTGFLDDLQSGLRHIRATPVILICVSAMVTIAFLFRSTDTLGILVLKALGLSEGMQGFSATALGMGYVAGAVVVGQWGGRFSAPSIFGAGIAVVGMMLAGIGVTAALGLTGIEVIVVAAFAGRLLLGMGYGTLIVAYGYIVQHNTPAAMMGRVSATSISLITGIPLISPLLGTTLANWIGLGMAYAAFGLLIVGVAATVFMLNAGRRRAAAS